MIRFATFKESRTANWPVWRVALDQQLSMEQSSSGARASRSPGHGATFRGGLEILSQSLCRAVSGTAVVGIRAAYVDYIDRRRRDARAGILALRRSTHQSDESGVLVHDRSRR